MNNSFNDVLRTKDTRKPDTYCAGAAFKDGQWYALIADGWRAKGVRNPQRWIPSGMDSEAAAIQFGEEHVKGLLQSRGLWSEDLNESRRPPRARQSEEMHRNSSSVSVAGPKVGAAENGRPLSIDDALLDHKAALGTGPTAWVGIDGGVSGAFATLYPDGSWEVHPAVVGRWNEDRVLDIPGNMKILEGMADKAGGFKNIFVAYERARKNKKFGIYNLFQIGRNDEFWRVSLTLRNVQFCDVDPRTWQCFCWGARGKGNTRLRALAYVQRRVPNSGWLNDYNKEQRKGIVDAMCIALWAAAIKIEPQLVTQAA